MVSTVSERDLVDTHGELNTGNFSETYERGRKRIDNIYDSKQLVTKNYVLLSSNGGYVRRGIPQRPPLHLRRFRY